MVRNYIKKGTYNTYSEDQRQAVLKEFRNRYRTGKTDKQISKDHNVPLSTVSRWKTYNRFSPLGTGKTTVFNLQEELLLTVYLVYSAKYGFPQNNHQLKLCIKSYLEYMKKRNPFPNGLPQKEWIANFKKRNRDIVKDRKREHLSLNRAKSLSPQNMRSFFTDVYEPEYNKRELENRPQCLWNLDETGIQAASDVKGGKVWVSAKSKHAYGLTANATKNSFTVLTCANAAGVYMPPFVLVKSKAGFTKGSITGGPPGTVYGHTKNGWMEGDTFQNWFILYFIPFVKKVDKTHHHVLVCDGHNSHLTYQTFKIARMNKISVICLPPNTSHATQPLDVGVFKNVKQQISTLILEYWRTSEQEKIDKNNFPIILKHLWPLLESSWVSQGFKAAGLHPLNIKACDSRTIDDPINDIKYEKIRGQAPSRIVKAMIKAVRDTLKPSPNKLVQEARAKTNNLKRIQASAGEVMTEKEGLERLRLHEEDQKAKRSAKGKGKGSGGASKGKANPKPKPAPPKPKSKAKAEAQCEPSVPAEDSSPMEVSLASAIQRGVSDHVVTRKRKSTMYNYVSKRVKVNETFIRAEQMYEGGPSLAFSEIQEDMTISHTGEKPYNAKINAKNNSKETKDAKKKAKNAKKPIETGEKPIETGEKPIYLFPSNYRKFI